MSESKIELPSPISFDWNGTMYTMEFSKATVKIAEQNFGITMNSFRGDMKVSLLPDMFFCSLLMHHPKMNRIVADTIFEQLEDKPALWVALYELFSAPVNSILADPEDEGKVIRWKK